MTTGRPWRLFFSCEHGGNEVPPEYQHLFAGRREVLATHRGWDIGVLELSQALAAQLDAPLEAAMVTRLLVDLNRAPHNPRGLFSEFTRELPYPERVRILERYYYPYRRRVEENVRHILRDERDVVHVAVHSFTPELHGEERNADLGLLYDPARPREAEFCSAWQQVLQELAPDLRVRRNYPYRGASDALVTTLRRSLPAERYLGLELEVNQAIAVGTGVELTRVRQALAASLQRVPGN